MDDCEFVNNKDKTEISEIENKWTIGETRKLKFYSFKSLTELINHWKAKKKRKCKLLVSGIKMWSSL